MSAKEPEVGKLYTFPVDVDEIRQHVRDALPGFNNAPPEINRLANDVQPLLRAYDKLRAALIEISELDLEGDASLADALRIADEALNP